MRRANAAFNVHVRKAVRSKIAVVKSSIFGCIYPLSKKMAKEALAQSTCADAGGAASHMQ